MTPLPGWPRLLDRAMAAAYAGVSGETFDHEFRPHLTEMKVGRAGRGIRFCRHQLDQVIDRRRDGTPSLADREKALETL